MWPESTQAQPKQFLELVGGQSTFQETIGRVAELAEGGELLVISGAAHAAQIHAQLQTPATLLLEPEGRDSAAALAAAAAWVARREPSAVLVVVSADHHVPDAEAFRSACRQAAEAAREGGVVTLGIRPTEPATAYGYIRPAPGEGVRDVEQFVEKPDRDTAKTYLAEGYLWNSGNFIARAETLLSAFREHAPDILAQVERALDEAEPAPGGLRLGAPFHQVRRISFDFAVMEKIRHAKVLEVSFGWSDVGSWAAVLGIGKHDPSGNGVRGQAVLEDVQRSLVRTPSGRRVVLVGVSDVAVVESDGDLLVMGTNRDQGLKAAIARVEPVRYFSDLAEADVWFRRWLMTSALPLWGCLGVDHEQGGVFEAIGADGGAIVAPRRGRLQGRQLFAFASGGMLGWQGPWRAIVRHELDYLKSRFLRPDGLMRTLVSRDGEVVDDTPALYDQAFALLGLATVCRAGYAVDEAEGLALELLKGLDGLRHSKGGFREFGAYPFQANANMHLFESALAWEAAAPGGPWEALSDELGGLALERFIVDGALREFFDPDWRPQAGDDGRRIDVGHQFEWAWLLHQWGGRRHRPDAQAAAASLYASGRRGVDPSRGCAINEVWQDFAPRDESARLWPQTEHLRAALIFGSAEDALGAASCLRRYLDTPIPGLWRDKWSKQGGFLAEPAPATSLYHIVGAVTALAQSEGALSLGA